MLIGGLGAQMPFKINWFYLKALRPEMRRDYIMRVDFLDYFKWNNFREECKIALQGKSVYPSAEV